MFCEFACSLGLKTKSSCQLMIHRNFSSSDSEKFQNYYSRRRGRVVKLEKTLLWSFSKLYPFPGTVFIYHDDGAQNMQHQTLESFFVKRKINKILMFCSQEPFLNAREGNFYYERDQSNSDYKVIDVLKNLKLFEVMNAFLRLETLYESYTFFYFNWIITSKFPQILKISSTT